MSNELNICRKILLSSSPGQFDTVVSNLTTIMTTSHLTDEFINDVRSAYNKQHNVIEDITNKDESNQMLETVHNKVDAHLSKNFNTSEVETKYRVIEKSSNNFMVEVNCDRVRLENCHSGSFTACYNLDLNNNTVDGKAEIVCHYFEDGNVQLATNVLFDSITVKPDPSLNNIFKQISRWENEIISKLQSMFEGINENILKSVRRVLPISKTKFEWNANLHRMVKCLEGPRK